MINCYFQLFISDFQDPGKNNCWLLARQLPEALEVDVTVQIRFAVLGRQLCGFSAC